MAGYKRDPRWRGVADSVLLADQSVETVARREGLALSTVKRWVAEARDEEDRVYGMIPGAVPLDQLTDAPLFALNDFGMWGRRYLGRVYTPWQVQASRIVVEKLATPHREFVVVNCPPGVGKTALFAHDIPAWLTCRDRSIVGLLGHKAERPATRYVSRLRRTLQRVGLYRPPDDDLELGMAVEAEESLVADYGRFKPLVTDRWAAGEIIVEQHGGESIVEKESTWTAYGMNSDSLGHRARYINWDDLVDTKLLRSAEQVKAQRDWWGREAEKRLKQGGVMLLVGQRLGPTDLYRYCLDMERLADTAADEDGDAEVTVVEAAVERKYTHIVFQAHDEAKCTGSHRPADMHAQPAGCLLDPKRLPWRDVSAEMERRDGTYETVYQQLDVAPHEMLVRQQWLWGGADDDGSMCPGCFDKDRVYGACPPAPEGRPLPLSYVTIDPSGTGFWSIQHWLWDAERDMDWLVQFEKRKFQINEILTWNFDTLKFEGLLEDMRKHAADAGHRVTHIVLEINAMNRWANQQDIWRRWEQHHEIITLPHTTGLNKSDPEKGVEAMCNRYRFGKVRLPGASRRDELLLRPFTEELTTATTSNGTGRNAGDAMMAQWMGTFNHDNMGRRKAKGGDQAPKKQGLPFKPMGYQRPA